MSNTKRIEWKTFWAIAPAATNAAMTSLTHTGVVDNWAAALIAGGGTVAAGAAAFTAIDTARMWIGISGRKRSAINRWLVAGVSTHAVAMQYAIWTIDGSVTSLIAAWTTAAATGALTFGGSKFAEWRLAAMADNEPKKSEVEASTVLTVENPNPTRDEITVAGALALIQMDQMVVRDSYPLRAGAGKVFIMRVTSAAGPKFRPDAGLAEQIAITLREKGQPDIESDLVRFDRRPKAGEWSLTILDRDIMAETIPYVDDATPTSIKTPALAGTDMIGNEVKESLRQHTRTVGQSTQGKSGLIHLDISHLSRCHDALLWIGGTWKLYDLVAEWLEPYEDTGIKPPIDWVAHTQDGLLDMLAGAVRYAKYRQSLPKSQRHWREIVIILDEISFAASNSRDKIYVDKMDGWCNVSELISQLNRASASSGIWLHLASQKGTNDQYGDEGAAVVANSSLLRMFASRDWLEVGRQLNDYDLQQPKHPGEYWMLGKSSQRQHLKAPYLQTSDPSKPRLHDGETISQVSWSRRNIHRPGLSPDEGSSAIGDAYTNRNQLVTSEWLTAIMTGANPITNASDDQIADAVDEIVTEQATQESAAASIPIPENRSDKIELILQTSADMDQESMEISEIRDWLTIFGDDTTVDTVSATLTRMKKGGQVSSVGRGLYRIA